ncbi:MAG: DEAD/DEAH box helicase [Thermoleophilaceae bacterium]
MAIRTGDTPQKERQAMLRRPPDVLITTPESLYLMLTGRAREFLTGVEWVIVDEIHAVAQTKRGAHLALTLERLDHAAERTVQRIGLSATQRPLEEVGRFLAGPTRECTLVDTGQRKPLDVRIQVPVEDMSEPGAHDVVDPALGGMGTAAGGGDLVGRARPRRRAWTARRRVSTSTRPPTSAFPTHLRPPSPDARSGRPSTPSCCASCRSTARRSSS